MSERPANPEVVEVLGDGEEGGETSEWLDLPFNYEIGFPQEYTFNVAVTDNPRTYKIKFMANASGGEYFLTVTVWDVTDTSRTAPIFIRKVLENIIYKVGYMLLMFTDINITSKYLSTYDDPEASIMGVVQAIE
jgi:hypothetical protein